MRQGTSFFFSVRGGLTLDEGIYIAQIVAQSGMFVINIMLIKTTVILSIGRCWE